ARWPSRSSKPARSGSPRLGRFDSCAAPFWPRVVWKRSQHRPERRTLNPPRRDTEAKQGSERPFRGLALVFLLTFVNLIGVIVTAAALGGLAPWSRWQFIGMFGVLEAASGLANVISPNIWRLPIAELHTSKRTDVQLA